MNKKIKKLVELSLIDGKINNRIAEYVLLKLTKKELKIYLRLLKNKINENRVIITSATVLSAIDKVKLEKKFAGKEVLFQQDENVGGGIIVTAGDTIIDLSVKNYIGTILQNLSQTI